MMKSHFQPILIFIAGLITTNIFARIKFLCVMLLCRVVLTSLTQKLVMVIVNCSVADKELTLVRYT